MATCQMAIFFQWANYFQRRQRRKLALFGDRMDARWRLFGSGTGAPEYRRTLS